MAAADYRLMTEATGQRIAAALENLAGFGAYLTTSDVVNDLTNGGTTVPLSAEMGKTLNTKLGNVVRKITVSGTTNANGELVTDVSWNNEPTTVSMGLGNSQYCMIRKSSSGKIVLFVFSSLFAPYANTNVTADIYYAANQ